MSAVDAAFWTVAPGRGELRPVTVDEPGPDEVRVRSLVSGISRGTETLVFAGRVPPGEYAKMRAPYQVGEFPGPVSYGYLNVGRVEAGAPALIGRTVFCLHPHHSVYVVPAAAVTEVPDDVPARRAVLTGAVETAINALWDAAPRVGDRVAVVGAGMIGLALARLLAQIPGVEVTVVDIDPAKAAVATGLGASFCAPGQIPTGLDLVCHTSATGAGLQTGLDALGPEGELLELSWYGDAEVRVRLGGSFHSSRLRLRASQVGTVAPARGVRRGTADRLQLALRLLADPAYDLLLTGDSPLAELPELLPRLVSGEQPAICHTISYPQGV